MKVKIMPLVLLTVFLITSGCGKAAPEYTRAYSGEDTAARMPMPAAAVQEMSMQYREASVTHDMMREEEASSGAANLNPTERKLIKQANVRIRVENLESADASVVNLMERYGAYAAATMVEENSRNYSLRVPAPQYDAFLSEMNGVGRLLHRYESTEDVTIRYYDLEGRLETKRELLRTFQSYLGRARNIEEILAVEARISELQYDIDGTGQQLRQLANRVDYATIDLTLLGPIAATQAQSITLGEQIKQLFGNFGSFLSAVAVALVGIVIYGIPVLLLLVLFFWLLFGKVGLMKKLWNAVRGKKQV